jgi:hypothetical protein
MLCVRSRGHAGYHQDTIAAVEGTVRWSARGERCPARIEPDAKFSTPCQLKPEHDGPHANRAQGVTWPREDRKPKGRPTDTQPERKPIPSVVMSRIRLHRAEIEHALAVAESRLEGQPVLTMAAKRLRLSVTLLRSELQAWTEIERYAGGDGA